MSTKLFEAFAMERMMKYDKNPFVEKMTLTLLH